jgi:hypothetical protein
MKKKSAKSCSMWGPHKMMFAVSMRALLVYLQADDVTTIFITAQDQFDKEGSDNTSYSKFLVLSSPSLLFHC